MQEGFVELVTQLIALLTYAVAAAGLAGIGLLLEYRSYLLSNGGEPFVAAWLAGLGLLLLGLAVLIARDKLPAAYRNLSTGSVE